MNKRVRVLSVLIGAVLVVGICMLLRRGNGAAKVTTSSMAPTASTPIDESGSAVEDAAAAVSNAAAVAPSAKSAKPVALGLVNGQLPTPDALRSQPRSNQSPAIQAGLAARTSRAAPLDRRLETHIAQLQLEAKSASPEQRQALERDIAILEAQLHARQGWESPAAEPRR